MSSQTQILVALIAAMGAIIAALIPAIIGKVGGKRQPIKVPTILMSGTVGLVVGIIVGLLVAYIVKPTDPCFSATITSPLGTQDRKNAAAFPVPSEVKLSWEPSTCVMIIQYYQNNKQVGDDIKNTVSGSALKFSGSGETEIKLWSVGSEKPSANTRVWVR